MERTYAEIGLEVILWKNTPLLWDSYRDAYLGKKTRITRLADDHSCCMVSCDCGQFIWQVSEMILASDEILLRESDRALVK